MARFGKGKAMDIQARKLLEQYRARRSRHEEKKAQALRGSRSTGLIHSDRTFDHYCASVTAAGEWFRDQEGLRHLAEITPTMGQEYLEMRAGEVGQRQLDNDRIALEFVVGKGTLERIMVPEDDRTPGRSYTSEQVSIILSSDSRNNSSASACSPSANADRINAKLNSFVSRAASRCEISPESALKALMSAYWVSVSTAEEALLVWFICCTSLPLHQ